MGSETMSYWVEIMDDLVPAGSSPLQWDGPMEALHKQISFMLLNVFNFIGISNWEFQSNFVFNTNILICCFNNANHSLVCI